MGPLQVIATTGSTGSPAVPSTVVIYAKNTATTNAITDVGGAGAWSTGADTVALIAYGTNGTSAGAGNVILTNPGNVLGALYLKRGQRHHHRERQCIVDVEPRRAGMPRAIPAG